MISEYANHASAESYQEEENDVPFKEFCTEIHGADCVGQFDDRQGQEKQRKTVTQGTQHVTRDF